MRHQKKGRRLSLKADSRRALKRSLVESLLRYGKITTTMARAKEIRPIVEKLVTRAKTDTIANRRVVSARVGSDAVTRKLFAELAPKYKTRAGGYTRITKLAEVRADAADTAIISFV